MAESHWFSILLGTGLAAVYVASSYLSVRFALRKPERLFTLVVMGGMAVRLFLSISVIAVILVLVPIDKRLFIASFFTVALIGMIVEILKLHRLPQKQNTSTAP